METRRMGRFVDVGYYMVYCGHQVIGNWQK